ncbi:MAG: hypothetical protein L6Q71_04585, partial [Planctomycetes bacterium]|nr:hypothetical protein [Planctomycetota bacterium]
FDGMRIPFAVTENALRYYVDLTKSFRRADFSGAAGMEVKRSEFEYTATCMFHRHVSLDQRPYSSVYVVTQRLYFHEYMDSLAALTIDRERHVIFDESGKLVTVLGDGPKSVTVS